MNKLNKIASKSDLMEIRIRHSELGTIKFNLFEELVINEGKINSELMDQPTVFGYLGLLSKKLNRMMKSQQMELDNIKGKYFVKYKDQINTSTNRPYSNEAAMEKVKLNPKYKKALEKFHDLEYDHGIIEVALSSFDQRAKMIQSISANNRKIS